jgi:exodeoxyribonuclease VII large subunit
MRYNSAMAKDGMEIWTISQITRRVKGLIEKEIGQVWLSGEISNWKVAASGHAYFTLKDENSQISAVMFRGRLGKLRFEPESGLEVLAHGQVSVYEQRGSYQIILDDMQPKGVGALQLAFEKLKEKLTAEGLFDEAHKKPLPLLPKRIGVVTSPTGAAIRDILHVLERRFANVHVLIHPARVQGKGAAQEIVAGIQALDAYGVDVMIVGRGGGSLEDLWPFNEESVVRAIHSAKTPVISAVGHEVDFALTDFAADLRAPTPSAAAEVVVREHAALLERVDLLKKRLCTSTQRQAEQARYRWRQAAQSYVFKRPDELFRQQRQRCDEVAMRFEDAARQVVEHARKRLERNAQTLALLSPHHRLHRERDRLAALQARFTQLAAGWPDAYYGQLRPLAAQLDALSPLAILGRGYALAWKLPERQLVRDGKDLSPGDTLELRFGAGSAQAKIESIEENPHAEKTE